MTKKVAGAGKYRATRGVSWRGANGEWVNREAGDEISDAPAKALEGFLAWPRQAPAAVTEAEWRAQQGLMEPATAGAGADEGEAGDGEA